MRFLEGDWVIADVNGKYSKTVGYVTKVGYSDRHIQVKQIIQVTNNQWEWIKPKVRSYMPVQLVSAVELFNQYQDKTTLIDLALQTKDKKWFEELTGEKQKWHAVEQ
ncbi:IDEAL domain-containing protein [Domibacillus robiginosus]|uniref:IDEAL domain-containing protein n=1 Tax=Domibacillus robiginosus TaxID=1071054 RepID=UPI00067D03A0|nr:IDEAL domain-containing protein [Domibacillus robiginosus]